VSKQISTSALRHALNHSWLRAIERDSQDKRPALRNHRTNHSTHSRTESNLPVPLTVHCSYPSLYAVLPSHGVYAICIVLHPLGAFDAHYL